MFEAANKTEKVSDRIIEQIRDAVLSGSVKPGDRLASEKELIAQFGVSKATMREALRVLEAMGLVEIRKGISGGVFIAEVDMKTTIHSIMNFLHFRSVSISDITMLRFTVEPSVAHLAAINATEKDLERLRQLAEITEADENGDAARDIGFHRYLARMTKNPLLILILDFVDNLLRDAKYELDLGPDFYRHVRQAHRRVVDCLEARDTCGARAEIAHDLLEVDRYMAEAAGTEPFEPAALGLNLEARYVAGPGELDPAALLGGGMLLSKKTSGELYVFVPEHREADEETTGSD